MNATAFAPAEFVAGLLDPDLPVPAAIGEARGGAVGRRYAIYRNNVVVGLMEAMRAAYPSTRAIMGAADFDRVARNFIAISPPRSAMMQDYGAGFAEFLATFAPLRASPYLADVARAERAFREAFHAADVEPLQGADLEGARGGGAAELTFRRHPALALVRSPFPVCDLFARRLAKPDKATDLAKAQCMMITRPALEVEVREIISVQHDFVDALAGGAMLGDAAEAAIAGSDDFDLAGTIALCLAAGAFAREVA